MINLLKSLWACALTVAFVGCLFVAGVFILVWEKIANSLRRSSDA